MKNRSKQVLSILLGLVLALGLLPGMRLTAHAASHNIIMTINNSQYGSVTVTVNGQTATSAEDGATVTLTVNPANGYRLKSISGEYNGSSVETLTNSGATVIGSCYTLEASSRVSARWNLYANNNVYSTITITSNVDGLNIKEAKFNKNYEAPGFDFSKLTVTPSNCNL